MGEAAWRSARTHSVAFLLALTAAVQLIALGANGPLIGAAAAALDIAVAIVALLLVRPDGRFWRGAAPVLACLALTILWAALPGIVPADAWPEAIDRAVRARVAPDLFLPGLARLCGGAALLVAAGALGYRRGLVRVGVDWLILLGLAQIMIGLLLRVQDPDQVWGYDKTINFARYTGTMINANANACASGMVAILAFGRVQTLLREGAPSTAGGMLLRIACGMVVIAAIGVCAISGSRTVLSLTVLGIVVQTLLDPVFRRWLLSPRGFAAMIAALAAAAVVVAIVGDTTMDRFQTLGTDGISRMGMWRHYARLAADAPLFGYGLGTFGEMNTGMIRTIGDAANYWYINSAHNELLELVLEGGAVFAVLMVTATTLLAVTALRHGGRHDDDPLIRAVPVALLLVAIESLVDIALDVPAVATLAILLLGMIWGRALRIVAERQFRAAASDSR